MFPIMIGSLSSCYWSDSEKELSKGDRFTEKKNYQKAISYYEKVMKGSNPEIVNKAVSRLAWLNYFYLKDFKKALQFYKYVVVHSPSRDERFSSQEKIIDIYFHKFGDYISSISEISKLLEVGHMKNEMKAEYKLKLAKSYFYLGDFIQAEIEADDLLSMTGIAGKYKFETLLLKGNALLTAKRLQRAVSVYKNLQEEFPKRSKKERIDLSISACYEEMNELDLAINELKRNQRPSDIIEMKIKRLQSRKRYLPGAKGLQR